MKPALSCLAGVFACVLTAAAADQSKWTVEEGRSVRDNSRAISLKLLPDRGTAGLSALCLEGNTRVTIVTLEPLPVSSNLTMLPVSYRTDANAWQTRSFLVEAKRDSFTIDGASAKEMLQELLGRGRLARALLKQPSSM
jgi:hypothetical protein